MYELVVSFFWFSSSLYKFAPRNSSCFFSSFCFCSGTEEEDEVDGLFACCAFNAASAIAAAASFSWRSTVDKNSESETFELVQTKEPIAQLKNEAIKDELSFHIVSIKKIN